MQLYEDFKYKCECYYGRVGKKELIKVSINDGSSAILLFRMAQYFNKNHLGLISNLLGVINKLLNSCVIGRNAIFGPGFVLMHPVGVVINGGVIGGRKIVVESGVVIGAAKNGFPISVPVLGDNIFIGSGAKLLGGIRVGNDTIIGANAVIVNDVPDGSTVVGVPGKIIKTNGNNSDNL